MTAAARRILVVDDDPMMHKLLKMHLDGVEATLVLADGAPRAYEVLAEGGIDLVLSDVMMPGENGFEMCQTIKRDPRWRHIPVVLLTSLDRPEDLVVGVDAGADEFLMKPVDSRVLRARVRAMLRIRSEYQRLAHPPAEELAALLRRRRDQLCEQAGLSAREREVLELLVLGRSQEDIGLVLGITARTAKFHQQRVLEKLGADSRVDLLRLFL